jgi:hypothetical protein
MNPQIIILEDQPYYLSNEVYVFDPSFFPGCQINMRLMIDKKNLKPNDYVFAYIKNEKWILSNMKYARAKLLLTTEWVENNVPKMIIYMRKNDKKMTTNPLIEDVNDLYDAPPAPPILYLNDDEGFKDMNGNTLDIEVRGERDHKKCFFKVKDVSIAFDMPKLSSTLTHKNNITETNNKYMMNVHYKYFTINKKDNPVNTIVKEIFLTYKGMLKVLYSSRSGNAELFQDWAEEILCTSQMGTVEQKNKLVSKLKGVSYDNIQELFSVHAREMPCIYLTALNTVGILRNEMKIDSIYADQDIVYKFGLTKSFERRKNEHNQEFKILDHLIDKKLVCYTYIDPLYLSEAEMEIKNLLEDNKIKWDQHDEIVVIPNQLMKYVKKGYESIGMKYAGHTAEFNKRILQLEMEIQQLKLKHENELALKDKDIQMLNKEIEFKSRENELLMKICELTKK